MKIALVLLLVAAVASAHFPLAGHIQKLMNQFRNPGGRWWSSGYHRPAVSLTARLIPG